MDAQVSQMMKSTLIIYTMIREAAPTGTSREAGLDRTVDNINNTVA
jgi:hypothetical protein